MLFSNSKIIKANLSDIYEFFSNTEIWQKAVPHCKYIQVLETNESGPVVIEKIKMVVSSKNGSEEEFITKRWKVKNSCITYNQITPPLGIDIHTGEWQFEQMDTGVKVTSSHLVFVSGSALALPEYKKYCFQDLEKIAKESITHNSEQIIEVCEKMLAGRM